VERFNRVLGGFIRTAVLSGSGNARESIANQLFMYLNTPHPLTGVSPAVLLMGRKLRSSLCISDLPSHASKRTNVREVARRVKKAQSKIVTNHSFPQLDVGDVVRVRKPGIVGKYVPALMPSSDSGEVRQGHLLDF